MHEKKRPRNVKRAVAIVLICALVLGAAGGGIYALKNRSGGSVNVYPVSQLGYSDSWMSRAQTGGQVTTDRMQSVYLSSTQTVTEVFVQEGQELKVGDPILAFDTTLDEVELDRKRIAIDQYELEIQKAEKALKEIDTYKIGSPGMHVIEPSIPVTPVPEATTPPVYQFGEGTAEDPFVFLWGEDLEFDDAMVEHLITLTIPTPTASPEPTAQDRFRDMTAEDILAEFQKWSADAPGLIAFYSGLSVLERQTVANALSEEQMGELTELLEGAGVPRPEEGYFPPKEEPEPSSSPAGPSGPAGPIGARASRPRPVAGQSVTARGLFAALGAGGARRVLRDGESSPAPAETAQPTEESTPTADPAQTPVPTETEAPSPAPETTAAPEDTDRFAGLDAGEIQKQFEDLREDPAALIAFYKSLTVREKQTVADTLSQEELAGLVALLAEAGVPAEEIDFPEKTPAPSAPAPQEEGPQDSGETGGPVQMMSLEPGRNSLSAPEDTGTETEPAPENTWKPVEGAQYYMVFELRDNDSLEGDILRSFEIRFLLTKSGWQFRIVPPGYVPVVPEQPQIEEPQVYFDPGQYYSAAEIRQMRAETQQQLTDLRLQLKIAQQDLKKVEFELSNGEVICEVPGVVKALRDPDEAREQNLPVVLVSGGGGYLITAYMSEFDMDVLHVGDTVTVDNWQAGEELDAEIKEISPYPVDSDYADYYVQSGNGNISVYPFTVMVGEDAALREGDYVSVYFDTAGASPDQESGTYISNAFLRSEGGRTYVYVDGPDGRLEKRFISTGRSAWGSSTEVTGGLTEEDYIAFPYGRSVKEGARTVRQETTDSLYT